MGEYMNKAEIIEKVAAEVGINKAQTEKWLDCTLDTSKKQLKKATKLNSLALVLS